MKIIGTYCEGDNCSKKSTCKLHCVDDTGENECYQYIDYSHYGSGSYTDGKCVIEHWCGNDSNNYPRYEPIENT